MKTSRFIENFAMRIQKQYLAEEQFILARCHAWWQWPEVYLIGGELSPATAESEPF